MAMKPKRWRDVLTIHKATDTLPMLDGDALAALAADIAANGLRVKAVWFRDFDKRGKPTLLDGRNRLDALALNGTSVILPDGTPDPQYLDEVVKDMTEGERYAFVASLNLHRRHLGIGQRKQLAALLLKGDPTRSNRSIGAETNLAGNTVGALREDMEGRAQIEHVETVKDSKGRKQPSHKPSIKVTGKSKPKLNDNVRKFTAPEPKAEPALDLAGLAPLTALHEFAETCDSITRSYLASLDAASRPLADVSIRRVRQWLADIDKGKP